MDIDLSHYREKYLNRRLYYRILRLEGVKTYKQYLNYIKNNPKEPKIFKEEMTIHVTHFFRDESPFRYLEKNILPKIGELKETMGKEEETIHILSAPCSTGEEPYSLAIIVDFLRKKEILRNPVKIYAYDLDPTVINIAKKGVYKVQSLEKISKISKLRNFHKINSEFWRVRKHLKKYIEFGIHDLLTPLHGAKLDLVVCRNFLIYIDKKNQRKVIHNLVRNLKDDGFLMLGKTEGFPLLDSDRFEPVNNREHIYKVKSKRRRH